MPMLRHEFGIVFWVYIAVILLAFASPFLFNPWIVIAGFLLIWVQYVVLKACVLTSLQFKSQHKEGFVEHYLKKLGLAEADLIALRMEQARPVLVVSAIAWQWIFGFHPLIT